MQPLSPQGQQAIDNIAQRHGFSTNAVLSMLTSVMNGNGRMAQFNHPEFSGSGQWMSGGMTMVSDMFNNYLKSRVNNLCTELAQLIASQPNLVNTGNAQSQNQNNPLQNNRPAVSLLVSPATSSDWWPSDLRWPNSTGAQNGVRYAHFAQARRLVIDVNGKVTVYDTLDHQIGGFSQQQSYGGSLSFSSQYGVMDVSKLPVVSVHINGVMQTTNPPLTTPTPSTPSLTSSPSQSSHSTTETDIFAMIDKLADLRNRAILTEEEFTSKKMELLARL
jgi:hypothetical protein